MHKFESTELGREKLRPEWKQNIKTLKETNECVVHYSSAIIDSSKKIELRVLREDELERILFEALKETRKEINEGKVVKGEAIFHKGRHIEKVGEDPAEWSKRFIEKVASKVSAASSGGKKAREGLYRYYLSDSCYEEGKFKFYF
jgi:hypothetical protein